jgi:type IV pilus assembly protein PilQ
MTGQPVNCRRSTVVLGVVMSAWLSAPAFAETAQVRAIRVSEAGGDTAIVISASAQPTFTTWKLEHPARVVVDISGVSLGNLEVPMDAGTYAVGLVSASVSEEEGGGHRTRVVVTLRQASDYRVEARGHDIVVRIIPHLRPAASQAASPDSHGVEVKAEARMKAERAEAQATAETKARAEAQARAEKAETLAKAEAQAKAEALAKAETQAKAASQAHAENAKLKQELQQARRDAEEAQAAAHAASAETDRQRAALARSDEHARKAEHEAGQARQRTEAAERETRTAQQREAEHDRVLQAATREVEVRTTALEAKAKSQEEQKRRLVEAEHLVADRDAKVRVAAAELAEREQAARAAQAQRDRIERNAALSPDRGRAATAMAKAEAERKNAAEAADRSRNDLTLAVAARRADEGRRQQEMTATAVSVRPAPDSAKPAARPRSVSLRVPIRIRRIDFVDEPTRSSVIIDLEEPSEFAVEHPTDRRVSLRLDHADLPEDLARSLDATEYLGPVRLISSYRDPHARSTVRVDVDLAEDVPNRVRQDGSRIYWEFHKSTPANGQKLPALGGPLSPSVWFVPARRVAGFSVTIPSLVLAQAQVPPRKAGEDESPVTRRASLTVKKRYTGRRIDLDFKGADIHNILRLLADVGQMNIVTSDDVKGEVTIKMRDVPWDQALDVVLRAKGLGSVREGNLVRVAPLSTLEKELEQEIARQKQIAEVLPTETRLIGVSYAHASSLQDKARDLLSPRGKISVDDRTNNLIVSDVARSLQLIEDLVRNLDTQTSQVVIEARIVEANSDYARQIGIQWGGNTFMDTAHGNPTGLVFPYNVGLGGGADDGSSPLSGLVPGVRSGTPGGASPNFVVNMPAPAGLNTGSAIGLTMGSVAGAFNLNLRLSAMESTGQVRILSSPRITTMDNIDATIEQGVSIPVSVVSAMGAQTQFVDAKLHLGVRPHVTNEGTIMLTVNVTKNEPDFVNTGSRGDPTILKKEAKTTMLVRDGDTAVIGGIYTRNSGLSYNKVPFFADIPVLGWFFRNRKENDNRTEFLVFLTPRIVNRARALGQ